MVPPDRPAALPDPDSDVPAPGARARFRRALRFPLARLVIALAFLLPALLLGNLFAIHVVEAASGFLYVLLLNLRHVLVFLGLIASYALYTRTVEHRRADETSLRGGGREFLVGWAISFAILAVLVSLLAVAGWYRVEEVNPPAVLLLGLIHYGFFAFLEELAVRVILFRLLEELAGSWIAMAVSGILFGLAHLPNPNATLWTSFAITAADTILACSAFMLTRRVWMVWGLHLGWNFTQSTLFGMPNSGTSVQGLFTPVVEGPAWITGGPFGIEASVIQVVFSLAVGLIVLRLVRRAGLVLPPPWKAGPSPQGALNRSP